MAFLKTGGFVQVSSLVRAPEDWFEAFEPFHSSRVQTRTASKVIEGYSPEEFLFTHNTIIASVDVDPNIDYMITAETQPFINDNRDAWERGVIANDWRSFIGAENYLEHVQIPHLSKGKVIDAALRDVGDSLYTDILVATNRKHEGLINRIMAGELNAMSMGCVCDYTICTKCGNKAVDEAQLCSCIRYEKGNVFIGPDGHNRVIAELCGHRDDPGSVQYIEASWVAYPAFRGAVTRNFLSVPELVAKAATTSFFIPSPRPVNRNGLSRAANLRTAEDVVMDEAESFYKGDDTLPPEAGPKKPQRFTEDIFDYLYFDDNPAQNLTQEYIQDDDRPFDISEKLEDADQSPVEFLEETLVHSSKAESLQDEYLSKYSSSGLTEAQLLRIQQGVRLYREGGFRRVAEAGFKGVELLSLRYFLERYRPVRTSSFETPLEDYAVVREIGGLSRYASRLDFLRVCTARLGRKFKSQKEAARLIALARLYDLAESVN